MSQIYFVTRIFIAGYRRDIQYNLQNSILKNTVIRYQLVSFSKQFNIIFYESEYFTCQQWMNTHLLLMSQVGKSLFIFKHPLFCFCFLFFFLIMFWDNTFPGNFLFPFYASDPFAESYNFLCMEAGEYCNSWSCY